MIFRPKGTENLNLGNISTGWQQSEKYTANHVKEFLDNADGVSRLISNSVPSPYARMYLFEQAFEYVKNKEIEGKSGYHYLVAQTIDVFELLFHYNAFKDKIRFVKWTIPHRLAELSRPTSHIGHQLLGNTLRLYRKNTFLEKYFAHLSENKKLDLNDLYFIVYEDKVIAGTSPFTGFFTPDEELPDFGMDLFAKIDDDTRMPRPLYQRSKTFQRYMYGLEQRSPEAFRNFKFLKEYIVLNRNRANVEQKEMNEILNNYNKNIESVEVATDSSLEVCGAVIGCESEAIQKEKIQRESDFVIRVREDFDDYFPDAFYPMALKEGFTQPWTYTTEGDHWKAAYKIDEELLVEQIQGRTLPHNTKYPFLTADDLLSDTMVRFPYELNTDYFYCGIFKGKGVESNFLPPLNKRYFDYFKPETIDEYLSYSIDAEDSRATKVRLKIPLRSGKFITLEKRYYFYQDSEIPEGAGLFYNIEDILSIFPFYKTGIPQYDNNYRLMLLHLGDSKLKLFADYHSIPEGSRQEKASPYLELEDLAKSFDRTRTERLTSSYYRAGASFDIIQFSTKVDNHEIEALILPKWRKPVLRNEPVTVSVDFGTTNTHIAYDFEQVQKGFDIKESEIQAVMLNLPNVRKPGKSNYDRYTILPGPPDNTNVSRHQFVPSIIGLADPVRVEYEFPFRSILIEDKDLGTVNKSEKNTILQSMNIDFSFGNSAFGNSASDTRILHNLKWSFDGKIQNTTRIRGYIKQLMMMIRAKVLINGYKPEKVKLIWFFPLSITSTHRQILQNFWDDIYKELFNKNGQTTSINESEAPYHWIQKQKGGTLAQRYLLSIDIGGGTSDVVFMRDGKILLGTSFIFGGNALFGDGVGNDREGFNGLAKYYDAKFDEIAKDQAVAFGEIAMIKKEIKSMINRSDALINFFFTASNKTNLWDFPALLQTDKYFKLSILVHFCAILWHTAQWLKSRTLAGNANILPPEQILLSGNGSKLVQLITKDLTNSELNRLAANIFKEVFGSEVSIKEKIPFIVNPEPKTVTCMGGLVYKGEGEVRQPDIYIGTDLSSDDPSYTKLTWNDLQTLETPSNNTDETVKQVKRLKNGIIRNVQAFAKFMEGQMDEIDFDWHFQISKPVDIKMSDIFNEESISDYLFVGIKHLGKIGYDTGTRLSQPLFFYPIVGCLYDLNERLYQAKQNKVSQL